MQIEGTNRTSARAIQFWILLLGSSFVSILLIKQIFLSRTLSLEQRQLVDNQETISTGPAWENAWKELAVHIYQASLQDPALAEVLKNENVLIHTGSPSGTGSSSATTPPVPSASTKTPVVPPHPAAP